MRKAKSIFQGKNEPVWVRPTGDLFSEGFREISKAPHWTYMSNYIPVYKV